MIAAASIFLIAIIWSRPLAPPPEVFVRQVQNFLFELAEIQANYDTRSNEIEPLADRVTNIIGARFSDQAIVIQNSKKASPSASDVAQTLKTQLLIVTDQLSLERK